MAAGLINVRTGRHQTAFAGRLTCPVSRDTYSKRLSGYIRKWVVYGDSGAEHRPISFSRHRGRASSFSPLSALTEL